MVIREGGYGLRIRPDQLKKRLCAGSLSLMLPPKLAVPGWNCAHLGWGELLQTPPHPTAAAASSPRRAGGSLPLPAEQSTGMINKGVNGAGGAGLPRGAAGGRTALQERWHVWGMLHSEGVWGLCGFSGISGIRCPVLSERRKRGGHLSRAMAVLADCFPRDLCLAFGVRKEFSGLVWPLRGFKQCSLPCLVQDLMVAALLKLHCESWGECDLNSVNHSEPPSWACGLSSLVFAELCFMFRLWQYRVNKLLPLLTNTLQLME